MAKILVVDDSAAVLGAVVRSLRDAGHSVTGTNCGDDALCLLSHGGATDLLVLDIGMPGMDGHAVLRGLGAASPPVLVITGSAVPEADLLGGRVVRVLRKPFDLDKLYAAVADVLASRSPAAAQGGC